MTPPAQVAEEPGVQVSDVSSPYKEPVTEDHREDATKRSPEGVANLTIDRLDKLLKSRKFLKEDSSFPTYNCA